MAFSESFRQHCISHFPIKFETNEDFNFRRRHNSFFSFSSWLWWKTLQRSNSAAATTTTMADWFLRFVCPDSPYVISMPFLYWLQILSLWLHFCLLLCLSLSSVVFMGRLAYFVVEFGIVCFLFHVEVLVMGLFRTFIEVEELSYKFGTEVSGLCVFGSYCIV